jgi:hypothetical protein
MIDGYAGTWSTGPAKHLTLESCNRNAICLGKLGTESTVATTPDRSRAIGLGSRSLLGLNWSGGWRSTGYRREIPTHSDSGLLTLVVRPADPLTAMGRRTPAAASGRRIGEGLGNMYIPAGDKSKSSWLAGHIQHHPGPNTGAAVVSSAVEPPVLASYFASCRTADDRLVLTLFR